MTYPRVLRLRGWAPRFHGTGGKLELRFEAFRPARPGRQPPFRGDVVVEVDRWFVRKLCEAIHEMQIQDRERIAGELERLAHEVEPLTRATKP